VREGSNFFTATPLMMHRQCGDIDSEDDWFSNPTSISAEVLSKIAKHFGLELQNRRHTLT
jgi:hypothetical protein